MRLQTQTMTWTDLADALGVNLVDLTEDLEIADELTDSPIYPCFLLDGIVEELNTNHENMPIIRAINRSLEVDQKQPYWLVYR